MITKKFRGRILNSKAYNQQTYDSMSGVYKATLAKMGDILLFRDLKEIQILNLKVAFLRASPSKIHELSPQRLFVVYFLLTKASSLPLSHQGLPLRSKIISRKTLFIPLSDILCEIGNNTKTRSLGKYNLDALPGALLVLQRQKQHGTKRLMESFLLIVNN